MRVIIAGGGTGGHVIPALAIAQQLKKQFAAEVLFIGTARGIETRLVPQAGFPLQLIKVGALKNVSLMTRARTMFDLPRALWTAGRMVSDFRPDVVIGVGGYASGPAMLAAIAAAFLVGLRAKRGSGIRQSHGRPLRLRRRRSLRSNLRIFS